MFKCTFPLFLLISICGNVVYSSNHGRDITAEEYIQKYKDAAISEMGKYKIPASITLAQAMIESANGNSDLAVKANNHFGIKCHSNWSGSTFIKDDDKKDECFRKYNSAIESYNDHSLFLATYSRYSPLFKLEITDYKEWAKGLKKLGYATNSKYDVVLIQLIEKYQLYQYDTDKSQQGNLAKEEKRKWNKTHEIYRLGIKKYIIIQPDDSMEKIAKETDKDLWQLYKYNDITKDEKLIAGQKLFLQPKRNKAKVAFHTVKKGETMKYISQLYGVKLKSLYDKNNMKQGEEPKPGDTLYMRKNKPTDSFE